MEITTEEERLIKTIRKAEISPVICLSLMEKAIQSKYEAKVSKTLEALKWYYNISKRKCKQCGKEFDNKDAIEDRYYCDICLESGDE